MGSGQVGDNAEPAASRQYADELVPHLVAHGAVKAEATMARHKMASIRAKRHKGSIWIDPLPSIRVAQ